MLCSSCQLIFDRLHSGSTPQVLTIFPVEAGLSLIFLLALQSFLHLLDHAIAGLGPVQEPAGAGFLHHLGPSEASQLTETIRAVHNGVTMATLGIS